jgi:hypothetical protein
VLGVVHCPDAWPYLQHSLMKYRHQVCGKTDVEQEVLGTTNRLPFFDTTRTAYKT